MMQARILRFADVLKPCRYLIVSVRLQIGFVHHYEQRLKTISRYQLLPPYIVACAQTIFLCVQKNSLGTRLLTQLCDFIGCSKVSAANPGILACVTRSARCRHDTSK